MKRLAILTGGGDAPGLNAVIRAAVKTAVLEYDAEVLGILDGFDGFTAEMFSFGSKQSLDALIPFISTTLQAMPEYISQVQPLPGWGNINLFITNITVYLQNNGFLILPFLLY